MRYIIAMVVIVLAFNSRVGAQATSSLDPIYLYDGSVFWTWTETDGLQVLTDQLPEQANAVLSPDRRWIAYTISTIPAEIAAGEDMGISGPTGSDLWLFNLENSEPLEIAGHPADLSDTTVRSTPVWSPDSTQLAWVDGAGVGTLMIYDMVTGETRAVAEGLEQGRVVLDAVQLAAWTDGGIHKWHEVRDDRNFITAYEWHFYHQETGDRTVIPISPIGMSQTWYLRRGGGDFASINESGAVLTLTEEGWMLINMRDSTSDTIKGGRILHYARNAPETSLRIPPGYRDSSDEDHFPVHNANGEQVMLLDSFPTLLSPDGDAILVDKHDGYLTVYRPNQPDLKIELPFLPNTVYWGETDLELQPNGDTVIFNTTCEGERLSFRLYTNGVATVLGTTANNVRAEPFRNADLVGQIEAGDWMTIRGGPHCADGITWWYVDHRSGLAGWTAEGVANVYFLRPGCLIEGCLNG